MKNPFLFACGVPRSGTTLLQRMLDAHPDMAVANDSHFIPRALEKTDRSLVVKATAGEPIPLTEELVENVFCYHRFRRLGIARDQFDLIAGDCETYEQLVAGIYDGYASNSKKRWAGEKTYDYCCRLPLLGRLFPDAKFIVIVRDGRDVALSLRQWATPTKGPGRIELWDENWVAVSALWWSWMVAESRRGAAQLAIGRVLEIAYEDLVRDSESTMRLVCAFLAIEFSHEMLDFHVGRQKPEPSMSAKKAWLAPKQGLRRWQYQMDCDDVRLFDLLAGSQLRDCGYEVGSSTVAPAIAETAECCWRWWRENFKGEAGSSPMPRNAAEVFLD